jgi:O-antigen/teichoic acid export membrane protein
MIVNFQRFRHLFKEGFWILLGQVMVVTGSLFGVRLLTGLLNPAEYGELALGMTVATLVNQTILGPLGQGVMRFYAPAAEANDLGGYLYSVKRLVLISVGVLFTATLIALLGLVVAGKTEWIAIIATATIFASIGGYNSILSAIQDAARHRSIVAIHQGIDAWIRFLMAALFITWLGATSNIAMIGYVLGATLIIISQSVFFLRSVPSPSQWIDRHQGWSQKIWQYSWPMSAYGIFTWLQLVSDRWALGLFRSTDEVGMYAALFQLSYYPISMATGMAVQFLAPIFFQRAGDGNDAKRNANVNNLSWRLTALALGLTGLIFCASLLLHAQIFQIFVAPKYRGVSYLLPGMVMAGGIFAASQTIALNLLSQTKTYAMMPVKIMTALLGIALNMVGGYSYGTGGIVVANIMFSVSCLVSMSVLSIYRK